MRKDWAALVPESDGISSRRRWTRGGGVVCGLDRLTCQSPSPGAAVGSDKLTRPSPKWALPSPFNQVALSSVETFAVCLTAQGDVRVREDHAVQAGRDIGWPLA